MQFQGVIMRKINKFCIACGSEIISKAKFCAECGEETTSQIEAKNDIIEDNGNIEKTMDTLFSSVEISKLNENAPPPSLEHLESDNPIPIPATKISAPKPIPAPNLSTFTPEPKPIQKSNKKGLIIGSILGVGLIAIGAFLWIPYAEEQREYEIAQAEKARVERQAAELEKQKEIELEKQKQAEILSAFEAAKASNRITTLGEFVKKYPDSAYRQEAEDLAYASLERQNSKLALTAFQKWFPTRDASLRSIEDIGEEDIYIETGNWTGDFDFAGKPHGYGSARFPSGITVVGQAVHGEILSGKKTYPNGTVYNGKFGDIIQEEGQGVWVEKSGFRYEGLFEKGYFHGKGKATYTDGVTYEGDWVKDKITGTGVWIEPNGMKYEGSFLESAFHGKGKIIFENGNIYDGDWVKDQRTGKGIFIFTNGDRYEGDFISNNHTGKGVLKYENGDHYTGDFLNGKLHGKGILTFANGEVWEGEFIQSVFQE